MIQGLYQKVYGSFLPLFKVLVVGAALVFASFQTTWASEATEVVEDFHEKLLTTMQNAEDWGYEKRREFLAPVIKDTFNTSLMVRLASSLHWRNFSEEEKENLAEAFYEFTLSNYASRFKGYSGQEFETVRERAMGHNRVLVETKLIKNDGDEVRLSYVVFPNPEGEPKIIDIYLDGKFSELSLRRSEFSPIIRDRGFTGLLDLLKTKVENLEADAIGKT